MGGSGERSHSSSGGSSGRHLCHEKNQHGGYSLVLQVSLFEPGREDQRRSMCLPIELLPDPLWYGASATLQTRRRTSSRTSGISGEGGSNDPSALTRIRNIDTGEEINVGDYDSMVPPGVSPQRLFGRGAYAVQRGSR
eukprot:TRINITY_DN12083_c0_g1_i1.p2 TRINITY_DN12083_c0_g1~~TRINITY_DN12083_c0_g1_i1.p2  ORF type:complete len:138 (+),score=10.17 TRINITY_DN12083_c0_g1_i1:212-625(+)